MRRLTLITVLFLLAAMPQAVARGAQFDGFIQSGSQIGVNYVDPGEGGTDCSHLDRVERGPWVPNYIDARGWICDKTVTCQASAAAVIILTGPWGLAYNPAFDAAAALEAGCTVASYTIACHQEDRNYQDGYKRHVVEYAGYYRYDHCRSRIIGDRWELDH